MLVSERKTEDPEKGGTMFLIPLLFIPLYKWFKERRNHSNHKDQSESSSA